MPDLEFFIPSLPWRCLSSNAGRRSRRDPWSVANARGLLKDDTIDAVRELRFKTPFETYTIPVMVSVELRHTFKRPKADECPRCRRLGAEYPSWALPAQGKPLPCVEYRPKDVGNAGGDVLKPILDGMVWMDVFKDDDYLNVPAVLLSIRKVETLEEEGVRVSISPVAVEGEAA